MQRALLQSDVQSKSDKSPVTVADYGMLLQFQSLHFGYAFAPSCDNNPSCCCICIKEACYHTLWRAKLVSCFFEIANVFSCWSFFTLVWRINVEVLLTPSPTWQGNMFLVWSLIVCKASYKVKRAGILIILLWLSIFTLSCSLWYMWIL